MEIVGDFLAPEATQKMLLDTFMQGFLFKLVRQKWDRISRFATMWPFDSRMHSRLGPTFSRAPRHVPDPAFRLKMEPEARHYFLATCNLVTASMLAGSEVIFVVLWWRNNSNISSTLSGFVNKARTLEPWVNAFAIRSKLVGYICSSIASILYCVANGSDRSPTDDAPMYAMLALSCYLSGKSFIASVCVSPLLPKSG
eukprot:974101-Prymnesium_polylepis.1